MSDRVRVTASNGLRLRDSPRDGLTLEVLPNQAELSLLGRETWLRVSHNGNVGFVLADYVEPMQDPAPAVQAAPDNLAQNPPLPNYTGTVAILDYTPRVDVFRGAPLRIDAEFAPCIEDLGHLAQIHQLQIFVTSSLREPGKPVANTVVKPAEFSNHHVGHAIDMNILADGRLLRSEDLRDLESLGGISPRAHAFIQAVRAQAGRYRWGGDFQQKDPVHIDNGLNVFHESVYVEKLQKLWGIAR